MEQKRRLVPIDESIGTVVLVECESTLGKTRSQIRVFYSWQSDRPSKCNLGSIRRAIDEAGRRIAKVTPSLEVVRDEATRNTSGSPNIALKILEKIDVADVFVADVTTITASDSIRPCPNPNVAYELGYAVSQLGWDRVILLFNEAFGVFPGDLPFDFIQHRAGRFRITQEESSQGTKDLTELLHRAITAIIDQNPKRPAELRGVSREKVRHDRDAETMNWFMSVIHLPTLDEHINQLPHSITNRSLWFHDRMVETAENSLFSLYDSTLKKLVQKLLSAWRHALSYNTLYHQATHGQTHIFGGPDSVASAVERARAWEDIEGCRATMRQALDGILARLRNAYLEVDLRKTNERAWASYCAAQEEANAFENSRTIQKPRKKTERASSARRSPPISDGRTRGRRQASGS